MKKTITKISLILLTSAAFILGSCASKPQIEDSITAPELIQRGQSEFESSNYENALYYYNTAVDRFGDNGAVYVEARYEIGHIFMKQKKYSDAVPVFDEIIMIFDKVPYGSLPAAYKKLSQLELEKIPETELTKIRENLQKKQQEDNNATKNGN